MTMMVLTDQTYGKEIAKAKSTLQNSGSTIDNHHNIPRTDYNSRGPGVDGNNPENGGGDANN